MESKTEVTTWKSIKNLLIRNWCQKWCCLLFGPIYREKKQCLRLSGFICKRWGVKRTCLDTYLYLISTAKNAFGCFCSQYYSNCSHVFEARYCVKMTGVYDGKLGTKRFCSSKDWGNYCEYIERPGGEFEFITAYYFCVSHSTRSWTVFDKILDQRSLMRKGP